MKQILDQPLGCAILFKHATKTLLPQSNFDDANDNHAVCRLANGEKNKWAYISDECVHEELGLPLPGAWAKMSAVECVQAIAVACHAAAPWPNNSQPRQLLTKLAGEVAHRLPQEVALEAVQDYSDED